MSFIIIIDVNGSFSGYSDENTSSTRILTTKNLYFIDKIAYSVTLATVALLSAVGNFLVTYTLLKKEEILSPSDRFVLSLTGSNFLFAVLVQPFSVIASVTQEWIFGVFWCHLTAFAFLLVSTASILTLTAIAIDRFYAIVKTMSYTQTITEFKSMMILAGVWLHALLCSFPFLLGWIELSFNSTSATCEPSWCKHSVYTLYIVVMCFVFPFFITLFCYIKIFLVAQSKYRKVGLTVGTISRSVSSGNRGDSTSRPVSNTEIEMAVRKRYWFTLNYNSQIKGIVVIFTIIGTFLFTWTPYVINLLWKITNRNSEVPDWFSRLSFCMAFICSISYSVIYGLLNRSIRSDMRSILCTQRHFPQSSLEFLRRVYSDMGHSEQFRPAQSRLPQRSISYDCVDMSSVNRSAIHGAHCNSSHDSGTIISLIDENNSGMSPPCTMLPAELFIFGRNSKTPSQQHHSCRKRSWIELPFKKTDVHDKVIKIPNSGVTSEGSISKHLKLFTIQSHNTDINVSRDDLNHSNIASEFFGAYEDELVSVSCHSNRDTDEGITQDFAE